MIWNALIRKEGGEKYFSSENRAKKYSSYVRHMKIGMTYNSAGIVFWVGVRDRKFVLHFNILNLPSYIKLGNETKINHIRELANRLWYLLCIIKGTQKWKRTDSTLLNSYKWPLIALFFLTYLKSKRVRWRKLYSCF